MRMQLFSHLIKSFLQNVGFENNRFYAVSMWNKVVAERTTKVEHKKILKKPLSYVVTVCFEKS